MHTLTATCNDPAAKIVKGDIIISLPIITWPMCQCAAE